MLHCKTIEAKSQSETEQFKESFFNMPPSAISEQDIFLILYLQFLFHIQNKKQNRKKGKMSAWHDTKTYGTWQKHLQYVVGSYFIAE